MNTSSGILGLEDEADYTRASGAMKFTDVEHLADRRLLQLSGGELQRVLITRAIWQQPRLILLDEPTAALDPFHQLKIMDLMEEFRQEQGTTIIMASHDLNLASLHGDRLMLLKKGRAVMTGKSRTVPAKDVLEASYGSRMEVDQSPLGHIARVTPVPDKFGERQL